MEIEPVTREERFLAAAGGQSVTPPTPITRKEQLLQGIIDAVKSGGATPDVIKDAVNDYLDANPVKPGATTEQAAQIEQNKTDIADLQTEIDNKQPKGEYVKTVNGNKPDASGNVVVATGGNGSGENAGYVAQSTPPADTSKLWIDTTDDTVDDPDDSGSATPQGKLVFTGAVSATYDGSKDVTVVIPNGGDGSGGGSYTLPVATESQLGGVMPVTKTDAMTQPVGVDGAGKLFTVPGTGSGGSAAWETLVDVTLEEAGTYANNDYDKNKKEYLLCIHLPVVETPIRITVGLFMGTVAYNYVNIGNTAYATNNLLYVKAIHDNGCLAFLGPSYGSDLYPGASPQPPGNAAMLMSSFNRSAGINITVELPAGTKIRLEGR